MIPEIALTNQVPTLFTDADCQMLVEAAAAALPGFCKEWDLAVPTVAYYPDASKCPATSWNIALLPAPPAGSGDDGVEAYHEDTTGTPDGKCFAGFLLAQPGGSKWTGDLAVSTAWTHEMFEALRNPRTNLVIQGPMVGPDGKTYANVWAEVCDPAQGEHFTWTINGTTIETAGWVTQAWEDPRENTGPYSQPSGIVPGPLKIGAQGYGGFGDSNGNVSTVFAEHVHPSIKALKSLHGRLADAERLANSLLGKVEKTVESVIAEVEKVV